MQITVYARKFSLMDTLRRYAEQRLQFALTGYGVHIQDIVMWLSDINRPNGREEKRCHIHVFLSRFSDVVVVDTEADFHLAIDRASDRAGRSVYAELNAKKNYSNNTSSSIPRSLLSKAFDFTDTRIPRFHEVKVEHKREGLPRDVY